MATEKICGILLNTARDDFPAFYAAASARETKLMDMLVLLTALFVRLNEPASGKKASNRWPDEERVATRQMFVDIRNFICGCRTFCELPGLEREKIQRVIFNRVG